jgi:hypothetical protein
MCRLGDHRDAAKLSSETKTIEVLPCGYNAQCRVKNCKDRATVILRGLNSIGRPTKQWECCTSHSEAVILREAQRGRNVVRLWTISSGP